MVDAKTKYAILIYRQLKRLEKRIELKRIELNEIVKRIPKEDMKYYIEQTEKIEREEEKKLM